LQKIREAKSKRQNVRIYLTELVPLTGASSP